MISNHDIELLIRKFFEASPIPTEPIVSSRSAEALEIESVFNGTLWHQVDQDYLIHHCDALFFLSEAGMFYYLPTYMLICLNQFDKADLIPSHLFTELYDSMNAAKTGNSTENRPFTELYTPSQKAVIALFIVRMLCSHETASWSDKALKLLRSYWYMYLSDDILHLN